MTPEGLDDDEVAGLLTNRDLPATFTRQRVVIAPGVHRPTTAEEWAGALVMVERGELEVHCRWGGHQRFLTGDVIVLGWLPLQRIGNPGSTPVTLVTVRRATRPPPVEAGLLRVIRRTRG